MVILRDSGLAKYVVVLDNKMTLSFDLDLKANQATNDLIYYMYLQQLSLWHSKAPIPSENSCQDLAQYCKQLQDLTR